MVYYDVVKYSSEFATKLIDLVDRYQSLGYKKSNFFGELKNFILNSFKNTPLTHDTIKSILDKAYSLTLTDYNDSLKYNTYTYSDKKDLVFGNFKQHVNNQKIEEEKDKSKTVYKKIVNKKPSSNTIFISHSTYDIDFTLALGKLLKKENIVSFIAHKGIKKSEKWPKIIQKMLDECKIMIIIASKSIEKSAWVNFEIGQFFKKDLIHPLFLGDLNKNLNYINDIQGYNLLKLDKPTFENEILHLVNNLKSELGLNKIENLPKDELDELFKI